MQTFIELILSFKKFLPVNLNFSYLLLTKIFSLIYISQNSLVLSGTHCGILAWRIPWTEKPAGYTPWGQLDMGEVTEDT